MAENVTGVMGAAGGSNDVAMATLHGGFADPKTPVDYYKAGDPATLPPSLVSLGLTAKIVGPPGKDQVALIQQMDNNKYQYLAGETNEDAPPARINDVYRGTENDYPREAFALFSAKKIADTVSASQPDVLAAQAQKLDNFVNNQSLVVHFTFNGKTMLFAGDAQWGNWDNFLFDGADVNDTTPLTGSAKAMLANLDFYKVGHHGSRNATPKPAVSNMKDGVVAMCSTQPGAYGSAGVLNKDGSVKKPETFVPQQPLLDALNAKTKQRLARSDQVGVPGTSPDTKDLKKKTNTDPLPSIFTRDDAKGCIDYTM
jgi:hypothetical protein